MEKVDSWSPGREKMEHSFWWFQQGQSHWGRKVWIKGTELINRSVPVLLPTNLLIDISAFSVLEMIYPTHHHQPSRGKAPSQSWHCPCQKHTLTSRYQLNPVQAPRPATWPFCDLATVFLNELTTVLSHSVDFPALCVSACVLLYT